MPQLFAPDAVSRFSHGRQAEFIRQRRGTRAAMTKR
jgi:hypothetical protein